MNIEQSISVILVFIATHFVVFRFVFMLNNVNISLDHQAAMINIIVDLDNIKLVVIIIMKNIKKKSKTRRTNMFILFCLTILPLLFVCPVPILQQPSSCEKRHDGSVF